MSKKSKVGIEHFYEEERAVRGGLSKMYEDYGTAEIKSVDDTAPPFNVTELRKNTDIQSADNETMLKECSDIRKNVEKGKTNNIVIDFIHGNQDFEGKEYELDDTIIKVEVMGSKEPIYYHINKGDVLQSMIFIGGNDANAFLVKKDEDGVFSVLRLSEIHMFSLSEDLSPKKETALMTSYSWMEAKVHSSIIIGPNLNPIRTLLLSDWIKNKKDSVQKKDIRMVGSNS